MKPLTFRSALVTCTVFGALALSGPAFANTGGAPGETLPDALLWTPPPVDDLTVAAADRSAGSPSGGASAAGASDGLADLLKSLDLDQAVPEILKQLPEK